jgi:hypothetical protein
MMMESNDTTHPVNDKVRPTYEPPKIQVMTEREILNTFQVTQAMVTWWVAC